MSNQTLKSMQTESPDRGRLQVQVTSTIGRIPISGATISISYTGDPESKVEQLTTNSSGQTETLDLPAPPLEYSLEPSDNQPYSEYTIQVNAPGYELSLIHISGRHK